MNKSTNQNFISSQYFLQIHFLSIANLFYASIILFSLLLKRFNKIYDKNDKMSKNTVNNKNKQNYKEKFRNLMNFYPSQVKAFLTKLKGLIKKITRSSNTQIESHTLTCHHLIVQLIKDDETLTAMNGQKLRLLAYEAILYVVQLLQLRNDPTKSHQKLDQRSKITTYLGDINMTLIEVKELLKKCQRDSVNNGRKSFLPTNQMLSKFDKNLNQYSSKLGVILTELQRQKNHTLQSQASLTSLSNLKQAEKQDDSDTIIEQMQRIIQKKEKKILQLTHMLKQSQNQKIQVQLEFSKYQNQMNSKNDDLLKQLFEITTRNKELELELEHKVQVSLRDTKRQSKRKLRIQKSILSIKLQLQNSVRKNHGSRQKIIEGMTEQTIPSICVLHPKQGSQRKISLDKVSSVKSFKRYGNQEQKITTYSFDKKFNQLNDKNDQLYLMLLCQASTIQEII